MSIEEMQAHAFPSPYWGLIFYQVEEGDTLWSIVKEFPSPYRGLFFYHTEGKIGENWYGTH